jgi:hypothetical protein
MRFCCSVWRAASAAVLSLLAQLSLAPACARASIAAPRHAPGMADQERELAAAAGRVDDGAPPEADPHPAAVADLHPVAVAVVSKIIMDIIKKAGTAGACGIRSIPQLQLCWPNKLILTASTHAHRTEANIYEPRVTGNSLPDSWS